MQECKSRHAENDDGFGFSFAAAGVNKGRDQPHESNMAPKAAA
jgi:hypothetical protein